MHGVEADDSIILAVLISAMGDPADDVVPLDPLEVARLTLSKFVGKIAASIDGISVIPLRRILWAPRMWHYRAIVDSRPGQLLSSAPES